MVMREAPLAATCDHLVACHRDNRPNSLDVNDITAV
jgi:hypothetical protein